MRHRWVKWTLVVVAVVLVTAVGSGLWWALTPLGPTDRALAALKSDAEMKVSETELGYEFAPAEGAVNGGLIFYPGGHVDVRSYAPLCRKIAANGRLVVLVKMPLSLAVFGSNRASAVMASHKEVGWWAIGGHSLGGAMAASYAAKNPDAVKALMLYAAYATASANLKHTSVWVLDTFGSQDAVLNRENHTAGKEFMPPSYEEIVIHGGNHAQFGDYGPQPGDNEASITASRQQQVAADATERTLLTVAP